MLDPHPYAPEPITSGGATSASVAKHRVGLLLTLAGNLLVIVAFFSPWLDVYKLDDPSYPFPKRGYSPWMALQGGQLGVVTWLFALLIVGMALSSLACVLTHTERRQAQAAFIARALAAISVTLMIVFVPGITFDLSFSWPFLSSSVDYGVSLAAAGFLGVLIGLTMLQAMPQTMPSKTSAQ